MTDIFGIDIDSSFNFSKGDINIVSGTNNLAQAIINRLNTDKGFYDSFYINYGGDLFNVFGMKNNSNSLEYLRIEIESICVQDPRIKDVTANCSKEDPKTVSVKLNVLPIGSDEIVTLNMVITDDLIVMLDDRYMDVRI